MIRDVEALEDLLSRPTPPTAEALRQAPGDLLILGAGGKMGPTLARMARRAADMAGDARRILAVSRFSDPAARSALEAAGVETIAGDLLDPAFIETLPECPNVLYMVGLKFGTSQAAAATWATNAYLPGVVSRRFTRSRIVSFSTGNVYPLVAVESGGCRETDPLQPVGEYGMSALARERVFEHFGRTLQIPMAILRLNYAVEMRYGVLVDLAQQIWAERPVSLAMGYFNCIWQGDANELTLRSLPLTEVPPRIFNLTGPTVLSTREVCERLAAQMGKPALFCDEPAPTALLNDARTSLEALGAPTTPLADVVAWTADWVAREAPTLNRPTHFEVRDGQF